MRSLPVLALAAAFVAAGCAGLGGPSTGPTAVTPAPVPDHTPTPFGPPVQLAPGVTSAGIVDPAAVVAAHRQALSNQSYTTVVTATVVVAGGSNVTGDEGRNGSSPGELLVATREVGRVGAGGGPVYRLRAVEGPLARPVPVVPGDERGAVSPPATVATWTNETASYRRVVGGDRPAYATVPLDRAGSGPPGPTPAVPALDLLEAVSTQAAASNHPGGLVQLSGFEATLDPGVRYPMDDRVSAPRELRLAVELAPTGVILELDVRYLGTLDGRPVAVEHSVDLRDLGTTTVGQPAWVATAANASG